MTNEWAIKLTQGDYQTLFEESQNILLLIDYQTGEIVHANKAACLFYQYTFNELISLNINDLNTLNEADIKIEMLKAMIEDRNYFNFSHQMKTGEIRDVRVISSPIKLNNRQYLYSHIIDVRKTSEQALNFNDIFYKSPSAIVILDKQEIVVAVNASFTNFFRYPAKDIINHKLDQFIIPEGMESELHVHLKRVYQGEIINQDTIRKTKNNQLIDVRVSGIPYVLHNEVIGVQVIYTDITEEVKNKRELKMFKALIQNHSDGVVITNEHKQIQWVNQAFTDITGYTINEVINKNPRLLQSSIQTPVYYKNMWATIEQTNQWQGEIWNKRKNKDIYPEWLHIFAMKDDYGVVKNYAGVFKDLSNIESVNKKMLLMLQNDPLTSLYNRLYFNERVKTILMTPSKKDAIIFLDIDKFKMINDKYGHLVGDKVLIEIAKKLLLVFKNDLVSRYGGDEFIIFMTGYKDDQEIDQLINTFKMMINKPILLNDILIDIKCSFGIAESQDDGNTLEALVQSADLAMYKAKTTVDKIVRFKDIC